jgi:hypothetical protein
MPDTQTLPPSQEKDNLKSIRLSIIAGLLTSGLLLFIWFVLSLIDTDYKWSFGSIIAFCVCSAPFQFLVTAGTYAWLTAVKRARYLLDAKSQKEKDNHP